MKLQQIITAACVAATSLGWAGGALAAIATGTLTVQVQIAPTCSLQPISLIFTNPGTMSSAVTAVQNIELKCTSGMNYSISFSWGLHAQSIQRRMKSSTGAAYINYGIYRNANHTLLLTPMGNGIISGVGTGVTQTIPIYGKIDAQSGVGVGTYSDSVQITVSY